MSRWLDRAEQLTYEGEVITETVTVGDGGVVVTTHRVLVFSPSDDGSAFADVDLPNVAGVEDTEEGDRTKLVLGAQGVVLGVVLFLAGALLPLDSMIGDVGFGEGAGRIGIGGFVGAIESVMGLLRNLDTVLFVLGALSLFVAAGAFGWYLYTRERRLVVQQAGADPLSVPTGEEPVPAEALDRLRAAIEPGADETDAGSHARPDPEPEDI